MFRENGIWVELRTKLFFSLPKIEAHDVRGICFQQDGVLRHTQRVKSLKNLVGEHLLSRFGLVNSSPISCVITILDCFLCGNSK